MGLSSKDILSTIARREIICYHIGIMLRGRQWAAATFAAWTAWMTFGDTPRATGYIPSPRGSAVRRIADPRPAARLRGTAKNNLPATWDSRDHGWITPVKDQGDIGACWAFGSCATLETQLLKSGRGEWDFSEKNMANLHGWSELGYDDGGFYEMAAGYLLRWTGAVAETNDVYATTTNAWTSSPTLAPVLHVQNIACIAPLDGTDEKIAALKEAVMEYGAVATSMNASSTYERRETGKVSTFYCPTSRGANHAVTLVGWDDNFPTNEFRTPPPTPGAWIVKNSWGADYSVDGYIRVSYCDKVFGRKDSGWVFIPAGEGEDYDVVRGYDFEGPAYDASANNSTVRSRHDLQASVFTATWHERLDAVGVWSSIFPNVCEIAIYTNVTRGAATPVAGGALACRQTNTLARAGFTTIPLDAPVALAPGIAFAVVCHQTGTDLSNHVNCGGFETFHPDHQAGNCYFGYFSEDNGIEGSTWFDGKTIAADDTEGVDPTDGSWAATIKAYTRSTIPARATDAPGVTDEGTAYLAALAATNAMLYAETAKTFGASIGLVGANGRSLWANWLAGLDPSDPSDAELVATISMENGVPRIGWTPDLGAARAYKVWGVNALDANEAWREVDPSAPGATGARFFKISVGQP